jgi:surface protein
MIGAFKIGVSAYRGGGGGTPPNPDFVSTWDTTKAGSASDTVVLPLLSGGTYSGTIDWGDGNTSVLSYANRTHIYASSGTYTITISGTIEGWKSSNAGDRLKIIEISNWGTLKFTTGQALHGCSNLVCTATDSPDFSGNSLSKMFEGAALFNADLSAWNTSAVTDMQNCFTGAAVFNGYIGSWDTSSVKQMQYMFYNASAFNQDISSWNTSSVQQMQVMFRNAIAFNQPIGSWNTSAVLYAQEMLRNCSAFDQNISAWDINQVTNFSSFLQFSTLSTVNYDALLVAWDAQGAMSFSGTAHFGSSKYTAGGAAEAARTSLISKWGGIIDGGPA